MKIKILLLLMVGVLSASAQNGYLLKCKFKGLPDGTKVYLRTEEQDTVSKAISKGDEFSFTGVLPLTGRFHFIVMDTLVSSISTKAILVENRTLNITGSVGKDAVIVTESQGQLDYENFTPQYALLTDSIEKATFKKEWFKSHANSVGASWIAFVYARVGSKEAQQYYDDLSPAVKASYYGVAAKNALETEKKKALVKEGAIIPNISINVKEGRELKILDLAAKSKYTLIDCWASWCTPCIAEIPVLRKLYASYKDKGLNVIGVSSDKKEADWKKAMINHPTDWIHGLELKSENLTGVFDLRSIPAYILIDSKGKLIAFDCAGSGVPNFGGGLRGEALEKKIEELLGSNK
jgi:thiol-disulfide isomerase/thioredoxin